MYDVYLLSMHVFIFCIHAGMYVDVSMHALMYVCLYVCMYVRMNVCVCMYVCMDVYVCMYAWMYVCLSVCLADADAAVICSNRSCTILGSIHSSSSMRSPDFRCL